MKVLYDVTDILNGKINKSYRTGVYFCSYNILKTLRNHSDVDIYAYVYGNNKHFISPLKKPEILKDLKFINIQDPFFYIKNINCHLNSMDNTNNVLLKLFILLKIIRNVLRIIYINKKRMGMKLKEVDAIFSPYGSFPEIIHSYNIKKIRLLHDVTPALFPNYFPVGMSSSWIDDMEKSLDKVTYYFCNSECTKRDFLKYFGGNLDENKMTVTYISSSNKFKPEYNKNAIKYIANKYKINSDKFKYIFFFFFLERRKNLEFTIKCFIKFIQKNNIDDLLFLIGGEMWNNYIHHFNEALGVLAENYRSKIIRLGYVEDSDVNMLYSNSLFFTYLSQYEGFGIPVLEAMQAGTPVIASNNSSLPEVVGDAAITIGCDDEEACITAMEKFYFNDDLRQAYIKKGFERAKLFSWDKTVNVIMEKMKDK
jgi:glycosyltransferase involved in cell wall biosynthesis